MYVSFVTVDMVFGHKIIELSFTIIDIFLRQHEGKLIRRTNTKNRPKPHSLAATFVLLDLS
jgi:hypothetical protein